MCSRWTSVYQFISLFVWCSLWLKQKGRLGPLLVLRLQFVTLKKTAFLFPRPVLVSILLSWSCVRSLWVWSIAPRTKKRQRREVHFVWQRQMFAWLKMITLPDKPTSDQEHIQVPFQRQRQSKQEMRGNQRALQCPCSTFTLHIYSDSHIHIHIHNG